MLIISIALPPSSVYALRTATPVESGVEEKLSRSLRPAAGLEEDVAENWRRTSQEMGIARQVLNNLLKQPAILLQSERRRSRSNRGNSRVLIHQLADFQTELESLQPLLAEPVPSNGNAERTTELLGRVQAAIRGTWRTIHQFDEEARHTFYDELLPILSNRSFSDRMAVYSELEGWAQIQERLHGRGVSVAPSGSSTGLEESSRRSVRLVEGLSVDVSAGQFGPDDSARLFVNLFRQHPEWLEGDLLELGTGSGALAIFFAQQGRNVVGLDIQTKSVEDADYNKSKLPEAVGSRLVFGVSDLYENLGSVTQDTARRFDAVVFVNPIFVDGFATPLGEAFKTAVYAGTNGEVVRRAVEGLPLALKPGKSGFFFAATENDTNIRVLSAGDLRAMLPNDQWQMEPTGTTITVPERFRQASEMLDGHIRYEVFRITPPVSAYAGQEKRIVVRINPETELPEWRRETEFRVSPESNSVRDLLLQPDPSSPAWYRQDPKEKLDQLVDLLQEGFDYYAQWIPLSGGSLVYYDVTPLQTYLQTEFQLLIPLATPQLNRMQYTDLANTITTRLFHPNRRSLISFPDQNDHSRVIEKDLTEDWQKIPYLDGRIPVWEAVSKPSERNPGFFTVEGWHQGPFAVHGAHSDPYWMQVPLEEYPNRLVQPIAELFTQIRNSPDDFRRYFGTLTTQLEERAHAEDEVWAYRFHGSVFPATPYTDHLIVDAILRPNSKVDVLWTRQKQAHLRNGEFFDSASNFVEFSGQLKRVIGVIEAVYLEKPEPEADRWALALFFEYAMGRYEDGVKAAKGIWTPYQREISWWFMSLLVEQGLPAEALGTGRKFQDGLWNELNTHRAGEAATAGRKALDWAKKLHRSFYITEEERADLLRQGPSITPPGVLIPGAAGQEEKIDLERFATELGPERTALFSVLENMVANIEQIPITHNTASDNTGIPNLLENLIVLSRQQGNLSSTLPVVRDVLQRMNTPQQISTALSLLISLRQEVSQVNWFSYQSQFPQVVLEAVRSRFMGIRFNFEFDIDRSEVRLVYDGGAEPSQAGWPRVLEQGIDRADILLDSKLQAVLVHRNRVASEMDAEKTADVVSLIELARAVNPEFITLIPTENRNNSTPDDGDRLLQEIDWQVFLPAGWLRSDGFSETARKASPINFKSIRWRQDDHLQFATIWEAEPDSAYEGMTRDNGPIGQAAHELLWVNEERSRLRPESILKLIKTPKNHNSKIPVLMRLEQLLDQGDSSQFLKTLAGYTRWEERKHAEDNLVAARQSRRELRMDPDKYLYTADILLKNTSFISRYYWRKGGLARSILGARSRYVTEFSGKLGATIGYIEELLNQQNPQMAYAVFLLYLLNVQGYNASDEAVEKGASLHFIRSVFDSQFLTSQQGIDYVAPGADLSPRFVNLMMGALLRVLENNRPTTENRASAALELLKSIYAKNLTVHGPGMMVNTAAGQEEKPEEFPTNRDPAFIGKLGEPRWGLQSNEWAGLWYLLDGKVPESLDDTLDELNQKLRGYPDGENFLGENDERLAGRLVYALYDWIRAKHGLDWSQWDYFFKLTNENIPADLQRLIAILGSMISKGTRFSSDTPLTLIELSMIRSFRDRIAGGLPLPQETISYEKPSATERFSYLVLGITLMGASWFYTHQDAARVVPPDNAPAPAIERREQSRTFSREVLRFKWQGEGPIAERNGERIDFNDWDKLGQALTPEQVDLFLREDERAESWLVPMNASIPIDRTIQVFDQVGIPAKQRPPSLNYFDLSNNVASAVTPDLLEEEIQDGDIVFLRADQVTPEGAKALIPEGVRARVVLLTPLMLEQVTARQLLAVASRLDPGETLWIQHLSYLMLEERKYLLIAA